MSFSNTTSRELTYPSGERRIFRRTAEDTGGALLEMEVTYIPNGPPPPTHFHPQQEEDFEVLEGQFRVEIDGEERIYGPGETFHIPAGSPHRMHNESEAEGRVIWQVRPALRTQQFFEAMWRAGRDRADGRPNILQLAAILRTYRTEFLLSSPPPIIQRALFGLLAPIGRLLGFSS